MSRRVVRTPHMSVDIEKLVVGMQRKREAKGLSLRSLSSMIGVSFSSLARIERREGQPDNNSIIRILEWLNSDGTELGLTFEKVALVHFRAEKNVKPKTMQCLLQAADLLKRSYVPNPMEKNESPENDRQSDSSPPDGVTLSKPEMEAMARQLRDAVSVDETKKLDALSVRVSGVRVCTPSEVNGLSESSLAYLTSEGRNDWSAMSVPLDASNEHWAILRNDNHSIERQRVTYLEECWHILLGHKLTKIAKISDAYGRTYDSNEEHDAYYLAAATLLPEKALAECVKKKESTAQIGLQFGASPELVDYRIKRLGLWLKHKSRAITSV